VILSVSRRTDIPAFYSKWFFNRLKEGFFLVKNPMNPHQISRVEINPSVIDCIVFWTKNPKPMLNQLDHLNGYNYYFQFTITPYDKTTEPNVPRKKHIIDTFIELSERIGKEKVIWRYDPIILTDIYTKEYHYKWFEYLAQKLCNYTDKCVISFLDLYKKIERNMKEIKVTPLLKSDMEKMADRLSKIASKYNLILESCSEEIQLDKFGINHGKCIDDKLISKLIGCNINVQKDTNQREVCGCVKSIDIGAYNTCKHHCLYCYANFSKETVEKQILEHDINSPLLIGNLSGDEKITDREIKSFIVKEEQIKLELP
jgi:DNA repair photolyase